ncbi:uncharacterized protein LOC113024125 isoform X2 [Astatotilapia calliptera]|uniref:uncharacterized protein LOC113024125 isoform X2 n=1 Tax=Astatotilapia calliptera TaxID=8154 RepID=UPI000E423C38|nr:uncharacterized protein LOC113024125 isoform X2 [Astatotilapia calliptera]
MLVNKHSSPHLYGHGLLNCCLSDLFGGGDWISGSVVDLTVRLGENITLYCDSTKPPEEYIVWYRNCTHENQPPLVLKLTKDSWKPICNRATLVNSLPRFHFVNNQSSGSYDLLIVNISDSDEGLYYCGTEQKQLQDKKDINLEFVQSYGSVVTRIKINFSDPHSSILTGQTSPQDCGMCWKLLFILCATFAALSSLLVSLLVHYLCQKTVDQQRPETSGKTRRTQDEDVLYATVETRQATERSKKKITYSSDLCTYSTVKTSGV